MGKPRYSPEQVKWIVDAKFKRALEYKDVAREFAGKWGEATTAEQMRHVVRAHLSSAGAGPLLDSAPGERGLVSSPSTSGSEKEPHKYADFTHAAFGGVRRVAGRARGVFYVTAASPVSDLSSQELTEDADGYGRNLHVPHFDAIRTFCRLRGAELVILPMRAHQKPLRDQPSHYDPRLESYREAFASEYVFNEHLKALDIHLNPQQVMPLTGLHRLRGGAAELAIDADGRPWIERFNQSLLIAHAKQDMEVIPTGNGTVPRIIHTTGCITRPEYLKNRIGALATEQHIIGGLIVEVDGERFTVRQVQASADGSFCDMGVRYRADGSESVRAKALRPGDIHATRESEEALEAWSDLADIIRPYEVFVEDVFDGASVSHHTQGKGLTRARRTQAQSSLQAELDYCRALLVRLEGLLCVGSDSKLLIVSSNHHDHLDRYLDEGRWLKDDVNYETAARMIVDALDGKSVLQMRLDPSGSYVWLTDEDDYLVEGVQMAAHGHLAANGMKGSAPALERVYWNAMVGHAHTPGIRGRLFTVGHSSEKRHGYNRGPSSWLWTAGVIWPGGQKQLITTVDGRLLLAGGTSDESE